MRKLLLLCAGLVLASAALGQQYKWKDKDGRVRYGDIPPPGVKATPLRAPSGPASPAAGQLTPAQKEAEFRKRQKQAQEAREKAASESQDTAIRKQNCAGAQQQVRMLESGQRVARTDAKGEQFFIDDAQRAEEIARARKAVSEWCG